ncbi:hypothetical protein SNEBB_005200 [Seison nebaliae]|nr:hypothetical protein SNEBB_005200 [Seison nebaliae]
MSLFGNKSTASTLFGGNSTTTTGASLFGSSGQATSTANKSFSIFGNNTTTTTAATTSGSSLFSKNLFGGTTTTSSGSGTTSLFGKPTTTSTGGTTPGLFNTTGGTGSSLFSQNSINQPSNTQNNVNMSILQKEADATLQSMVEQQQMEHKMRLALNMPQIFNDHRDRLMASFHQLIASWGAKENISITTEKTNEVIGTSKFLMGKPSTTIVSTTNDDKQIRAYFNQNEFIQFDMDTVYCRFKSISYSLLMNYNDDDGLIGMIIQKPIEEVRNKIVELRDFLVKDAFQLSLHHTLHIISVTENHLNSSSPHDISSSKPQQTTTNQPQFSLFNKSATTTTTSLSSSIFGNDNISSTSSTCVSFKIEERLLPTKKIYVSASRLLNLMEQPAIDTKPTSTTTSMFSIQKSTNKGKTLREFLKEKLQMTHIFAVTRLSPEDLRRLLHSMPLNIAPQLWEQAKANNPDSTQYIPVVNLGFQDLSIRLTTQEKLKMAQIKKLSELSATISEMVMKGKQMTEKSRQLSENHFDLSHRLLRVMLYVLLRRRCNSAFTDGEERMSYLLQKIVQRLTASTSSANTTNVNVILRERIDLLSNRLDLLRKNRDTFNIDIQIANSETEENKENETKTLDELMNRNEFNRMKNCISQQQQAIRTMVQNCKYNSMILNTIHHNFDRVK